VIKGFKMKNGKCPKCNSTSVFMNRSGIEWADEGSLEVAPGVQLVDSGAIPDEWKPGVLGLREALYLLRAEPDLEWTFLSPSATIAPGERTGRFRLGTDQLLMDADGQSRISVEDYAVAMVDELEDPKHIRMRFTVGY
jgi:uncharacterized protein